MNLANNKAFYTKGKFIDFCKEVFGDHSGVKISTDNIEVVCPICKILKERQKRVPYHKKKLAIHTTEHVVHCWVCGYKSKSIFHLIKTYKPEHAKKYLEEFAKAEDLTALLQPGNKENTTSTKNSKPELPEDFCLLSMASRKERHVVEALNYLKARGADSVDDLWYWRLGVSKDDRKLSRRVIVPSFDAYGNVNYYSARAYDKSIKPKYENPSVDREKIIFNELNIDWGSELVLVEGVFDLIKCTDNATTILGSELPGHFMLFQKIVENKTPIVLALDPDATEKSYKIAQRLFEFDVPVKILEIDPAVHEDVGSMSKEQFKASLQNAQSFNVEYLLKAKIRKIV